jgi:hypothetical protein
MFVVSKPGGSFHTLFLSRRWGTSTTCPPATDVHILRNLLNLVDHLHLHLPDHVAPPARPLGSSFEVPLQLPLSSLLPLT